MQLSIFLGPMLAGGLIAAFASQPEAAGKNLKGIGLAIAINALAYLISAITLWFIKITRAKTGTHQSSLLASILEGVRFVWKDSALRLVYIMIAVVNLIFVGPLLVGIPVLADARLPQGAAAYGMIMSAYGGGNLIGILLAGTLPRFKPQVMAPLLVGLIFIFGAALAMFAFFTTTLPFIVVMLLLGIGNGYLGILIYTFLMSKTPKEMIGRVMSLLLFANLGLVPISQAVSGMLLKVSINGVFIIAGILMMCTAVGMLLTPDLKIVVQRISGAETN
jgi:MFS family permease